MKDIAHRLCSVYERKAFLDGLQYGAYLIKGLSANQQIYFYGRHRSFHQCPLLFQC